MTFARLLGPALLGLTTIGAACSEPCEPAPEEGALGEATPWEQAYMAGSDAPSPAERLTLDAEDGLPLAYTEWVPEDWDGTGPIVLFVHGSGAYGDLYATHGQTLAEEGVFARLIDVRGHGWSVCTEAGVCGAPDSVPTPADDGRYWVGRKGDARDVDQHARDVHAHVADLRARWPDASLTLAGHSSGGGLVSRYASQIGTASLDRIALLAPFNHAEQPQNDLHTWECGAVSGTDYARVDLGALGDALRGHPHRYVLSLHKEASYTTPIDTLQYSWTTMVGMAVEREDFHDTLQVPTVWYAAEQDALMDLERSRLEFERLPRGASFVTVQDTSHIGLAWSASVSRHLARAAHGEELPREDRFSGAP